jgi:ribonuclease E
MFNPTVQLKSGGYIVIGITEALVAIDVNSGRATKEGSIEDTALKTNLEAAEEVARQLRLRDLAGLIVIDFIDMEERRNNLAVEKRLKDRLKTDRARIQVGRISGFGLMEMSRQRLRPGMLESTTQPCAHCHGTGLIRSDDSLGLQVLRALEEEGVRKRSREVLLRAPIGIVNFLINNKREHIALIELRTGMSVRIECDPTLISPDYSIEKFKTATRLVVENSAAISGNASLMGAPVAEEYLEDEVLDDVLDDAADEESELIATSGAGAALRADSTGDGKKRRRRRRRKPRAGETGTDLARDETGSDDESADDAVVGAETGVDDITGTVEDTPAQPPKRTRAPRGGKKITGEKADAPVDIAPASQDVSQPSSASEAVAEAFGELSDAPKPPARTPRSRAKAKPSDQIDADQPAARSPRAGKAKVAAAAPEAPVVSEASGISQAVDVTSAPEAPASPPAAAVEASLPQQAIAPADPVDALAAQVAPTPEKPRKKGWWNLG